MIDLHMHTIHSDGTDTVKELLEKAQKNNLEIISITDHNSIDAYIEIEENEKLRTYYSGKLIVGSEIGTSYKNVNIEILAYGIDYRKIEVNNNVQEKVQNIILNHFKKVSKKLGLQYDENIKLDNKNPSKQFASSVFADEILKFEDNKKIIEKIGGISEKNFFYREHETNPNSPFYIDTTAYYKKIDTLIEEIHDCGGKAFLAHGYLYSYENKEKAIEEILSNTNIDGAECEYPLFSKRQRKNIKDLCKKYNKFISGGSDYHAKNKPNIKMGTGIENNLCISKEMVDDWIKDIPSII